MVLILLSLIVIIISNFSFLSKGKARIFLDFDNYEVQDCSVHIVLPGQIHVVDRHETSFGKLMVFTDDFIDFNQGIQLNPKFNNLSSQVITMSKEKFKEFYELVNQTEQIFQDDSIFKTKLLKSYLNIILLKFFEELHSKDLFKKEFNSNITRRFKELIEEQFKENKRVALYANSLSVSQKHLTEKVKRDTGFTPNELINHRVILEAKRMLKSTKSSVKEIAYDLNFKDPSHFNKFFKLHANKSPKRFREIVTKTP